MKQMVREILEITNLNIGINLACQQADYEDDEKGRI